MASLERPAIGMESPLLHERPMWIATGPVAYFWKDTSSTNTL